MLLQRERAGERHVVEPILGAVHWEVEIGEKIGRGGEGVIYRAANNPLVAVKLWHQPRARLATPIVIGNVGTNAARVAWPIGTLIDEDATVMGVVMPLVDDSHRLLEPIIGQQFFPSPNPVGWHDRLFVLYRVAMALAFLERTGISIPDISGSNVFVRESDLETWLVDTDSAVQIDAVADHQLRPSAAPPECLDSRSGSAGARAQDVARWTFPVLVCRTLLCGSHPFSGVPYDDSGGPRSPIDNVRAGWCALDPDAPLHQASGAFDPNILPANLLALAQQCFVNGASKPKNRPSLSNWETELLRALGQLRECNVWPAGHLFAGNLDVCPWCERDARILGHPFKHVDALEYGGARV